MKHSILSSILIVLSLNVSAQYNAPCFTINESVSLQPVSVGVNIADTVTTIQLSNPQQISGFYVSGQSSLWDQNDCYIRVTCQDNQGLEYLVYENYPLLSDSLNTHFSKVGLETSIMSNVEVESIRIETHRASLALDSVYYAYNSYPSGSNGAPPLMIEAIRQAQSNYIIQKINSDSTLTWRAGETSVSLMTYEEKKDMFGEEVPELYGFEYYIDGIFVMPGFDASLQQNEIGDDGNSYVSEWDWRCRHGKNWMSPVKSQGGCGSCWIFSSVGAFESYTNLYYNQLLNYDLSEQEILSCLDGNDKCSGGHPYKVLDYIKMNGIIPEDCFPYAARVKPCEDKCNDPEDILYLGGYNSITYNENSIKRALFKAPIVLSIIPWRHSVVCAGFKTIESGENYGLKVNYFSENDSIVGRPAWLVKNSWGSYWGMNGYAYIAVPTSKLYYTYQLSGEVTSQILDNDDIVWEDADGDGLYFWGVGPKPANCPFWVPDEEDGDDSDYSKGSADEFGFLHEIIPDQMDTIFIDQDTEFALIDFTTARHIVVRNNASLTISNHLKCYPGVSLTVEPGASLHVSDGILENVILKVNPGSELTLSNNGTIINSKSRPFNIPKGARFNQLSGEIR